MPDTWARAPGIKPDPEINGGDLLVYFIYTMSRCWGELIRGLIDEYLVSVGSLDGHQRLMTSQKSIKLGVNTIYLAETQL